jgi:histidinol dehydrogenase
MPWLRKIEASEVQKSSIAQVSEETTRKVLPIMQDVQQKGDEALRAYAVQFGDLKPNDPWVISAKDLNKAKEALPYEQRALLERVAERIQLFAQAQKNTLTSLHTSLGNIQMGHTISPVHSAGCYAPGGRFPLPSSVLMTAITARVAGVASVWVASPKPTPITLAAAAIAQADALIACGGAQAIAALAYGTASIPACDIVVGPGNAYVTAAKKHISGHTGIDMLAGPSELVVFTDGSVSPHTAAADLLAQAEHDPEARPVLITTQALFAQQVEQALDVLLASLPTASIAQQALRNGFCVVAKSTEEAIDVCNTLAPEHLEVHMQKPDDVVPLLKHYGGLFVGKHACEVLGDYGIGPNHVLPTSGCARYTGGLSVFTFLRIRTYLKSDTQADEQILRDCAALARLEGLEAHARAAEERL